MADVDPQLSATQALIDRLRTNIEELRAALDQRTATIGALEQQLRRKG